MKGNKLAMVLGVVSLFAAIAAAVTAVVLFLEKKKKEKEEWMKKVCVVPLSIWQCPNGVRVPVPWHRSFWEQL